MKEITVDESSLRTMCRLCLSKSVGKVDIFKYSSSLKNQIANVIMKCAPVQILVHDGMPNFVCQLCYSQLKKIQKFQMQAVQSEKTLQFYVQKLYPSSKQTKVENSIESSEDHLIHNSNENVTIKCEALKLEEVFETDVNWKEKEFVSCNSEQIIKQESGCDNSLIPTEYETVNILFNDDRRCYDRNIQTTGVGENIVANWEEKVPANFSSAEKNDGDFCVNSEIKCEPTNNSSLILREYIDDTVNTSMTDNSSKINCENPKLDIRITEYSDKCDEGNKNILENNEKRRNTTKKKKYNCDIIDYFAAHKRLHADDRPTQCDFCYKYFSNLSDLNTHKLTHTGEKPYKCDICHKYFSKYCNLKYHSRTHTGEKPYQCDICNRWFARPDSLVAHKRTHTGAKLYQCEFCEKWFTRLNNLNVHKQLHTGEKRYQCDLCNKCFTRSNSLKYHKRKHTGENPYQCGA